MASRSPKNAPRKQEKKQRRLRRLKRKGERSSPGMPMTVSDLQHAANHLAEKAERSMPGVPMTVVVSPPGVQKMSEVLEDFAEPYMEDDTLADHDVHDVYSLCVMAWNAALLPDHKQEDMIDKIVRTCLTRETAADRRIFRRLVESMIERKKTQFPHVNRGIFSFELRDLGDDDYYLTVVSTLGRAPSP
jgi:hypothetical protein